MTTRRIRFVTVPEVLRLHAILIEDQGGDPSLRDAGLLESAVAQPQQTMFGEYLHADIVSMAAAYAFHICKNHPFIDGNKRAATAAMIKFLNDNGWTFRATADEAEPVILRLASGEMEKRELTDWLHGHAKEKPRMELRDFFSGMDASKYSSWLESMRAGSWREQQATISEAAQAMPLAAALVRWLNSLPEADQNSPDVQHAIQELLTLTTLYRLAEDMGYEW